MNELRVQIRFDKERTIEDLSYIEREQFPFAYASALTRIAEEGAEAVRQITAERFELKTDFIPKGISKSSAKKSDIRAGRPAYAVVFTKERISSFMPKHEEGEERRPESASLGGGSDKGKALALPGKGVGGSQFATSKQARERFETGTGKIKRSKTPAKMLERYNRGGDLQRARKVGRGGRKKSPFVVTTKNGMPMIVRRVGKKRYPLEILYVFRSSAKFEANWGMAETVQKYVDNNFERVFREEMNKAIQTRRR